MDIKKAFSLILVILCILPLSSCKKGEMPSAKIIERNTGFVSVQGNTAEEIPETETTAETAETRTTETEVQTQEQTTATAATAAAAYSAGQFSASASGIELLSLTSPIGRGYTAKIKIKGKPNTVYSISVIYKSGKSSAKGLENKNSDSDGYVSWSWKIGGKTAVGTYPIEISGNGESISASITIT